MSRRADALADRLEQGANALITLAAGLSDEEWQVRIPGDGRKVGVIVHHVGNMYPIEIELAQALASGKPIAGVSWDDVHSINAKHAKEFEKVSKAEAIEFVRRNSEAASAAIRKLTDAELDRANTVSLNSDAPLTCQFFIEDHAMRHSWHHTAGIRRALASRPVSVAV
jgi:DinB family protein